MLRLSLLWLVSLAALHAQDRLVFSDISFFDYFGDRFVIDTNLRCRAKPSLDSAVGGRLPMGHQVMSRYATSEETLVGGAKWYRSKGSECWIYGPSTFLWNTNDREPVAFAILDRLTRRDARFEDFLEVEKAMVDNFGWKLDGKDAHVSPRLRFKILEMLDHAVGFAESFSSAFRSWEVLHGDLLRRAPEPDQIAVTVSPEEYWKLFEANRSEPWADDAAWLASQWGPYRDECNSLCQLDWVGQREAKYWGKLPRGRHIGEALSSASSTAADVAKTCDDSIERKDVVALLDSLAKVTHPSKQALVSALNEIARKCAK